MRRLPVICIGECVFTNTDTIRVDDFESPKWDDVMVLGNKAFEKVVLTIDYRKQELVIRTHEYDMSKEKRSPDSHLLSFSWIKDNPILGSRPVIGAEIAAQPVHLVLDTGLNAVLLSHSAAARCLSKQHRVQASMMSPFAKSGAIEVIPGVIVSLGGVSLANQLVAVMPNASSDADGSIGISLLKSYRVTVDYSRRKVLLEPYQ